MLVVETIAKIRRACLKDKKPIKQICRELRVSRKTVRKVVRLGATEFTYERSVQPQPKIGPWRDELDRMLAENARKPKRDRLTAIRIFEELQTLGYEGGYDAVRRYAAAWSKAESAASAATFVPLRGTRSCGATLRSRRSLPVRLEVRRISRSSSGRSARRTDRSDRRGDHDGEGRPCPALSQPDGLRPGLSARDARDGLRRP